jgi:threonine dehydrogenase-like Zn-dependent dehydrogenase
MRVVMNCELTALEEDARGEWPLLATLTSGEALGVDVVIAATGVEPSVEWCVAAG